MNSLITEVLALKKTIGLKVDARLKEFKDFKYKNTEEWFSELCFCILTANSKARTAIDIQEGLGFKGFSEMPEKKLSEHIKKKKHRFHNNKAKYIVLVRDYIDIKGIILGWIHEEGVLGAREWLAHEVKGIGYKEASHFMRNVGFTDVAILDRHIINLMIENKIIKTKPKNLGKKNYLLLEAKFKELADQANMSMAELDLYMWSMKGGDVLK
ncbi:MAG: N-glycosylase/DNA lyase [archaeon]